MDDLKLLIIYTGRSRTCKLNTVSARKSNPQTSCNEKAVQQYGNTPLNLINDD